MKLSGGRQLAKINRQNTELGSLLSRLIDAHNHLAGQLGVDPVGQASAPPTPSSISATVIGEQLHLRIADNNATTRSREYFSEIHTNPDFSDPKMIIQHGATRDASVNLPTLNGDGVMQAYYVRSYSQTPGSPPSTPLPYHTYITMDPSGSTQGDLPSSAGSGTSAANGQQSAQGYGVQPNRRATGLKRQIS